MRKLIVQWSLILLSLSLLRLFAAPIVFNIGGMDFSFAVIGSLVGLVALVFTSQIWDNIDFRPLFTLGALASLGLTIACLYSPTLGSLRHTYVSLLDIYVALECSVILGLAALQPKTDALSVLAATSLAIQLLTRRLRHQPSSGPRLRNA